MRRRHRRSQPFEGLTPASYCNVPSVWLCGLWDVASLNKRGLCFYLLVWPAVEPQGSAADLWSSERLLLDIRPRLNFGQQLSETLPRLPTSLSLHLLCVFLLDACRIAKILARFKCYINHSLERLLLEAGVGFIFGFWRFNQIFMSRCQWQHDVFLLYDLSDALREFLQKWHKHSQWLKDEFKRVWWSEVKVQSQSYVIICDISELHYIWHQPRPCCPWLTDPRASYSVFISNKIM